MRKYTDFVFATGGGGAIPGATVTVNISGGGLATLYSDEGITAIENPVLSDENGKFEFYVADGSYDISIYDGIGTQTITDVQIYDESTFAYSGANSDLTSLTGITGGIASPDYIQFDTGATNTGGIGKVIWNDTDGTLEFMLKGGNVTLQVGQEQVVRVTNQTGSTMTDGQAVYVTGSTGNHLDVVLAQANSEATSSKTLAIVTEHIAHNQSGFATVLGLVRDLDTSAFAEGAAIWLSPTVAGGLTTTRPTAPNHGVFIGWCVRQHASVGSIFVNIQNGHELGELHDVLISGTPLAGSTLIYDATVGVWKNARITAGSNITITNADGEITIAASGGSGSGDVVGPASATNNGVVLYDGTTGKLIKDSGVLLSAKQDALVSGTNIKTVGGVSLLGAGDAGTIGIAYGGTGQTTAANARVALLPSLTGNNGKVLAVNSGQTDVEWIAAGGTGTVTSVSGTGTVSGLSLSGTVTGAGSLTLGGTLSLSSGDITTGLGFTPYNATNPAGYTTNTGTVTSVAALTLGTTGTDLSSSVATGTTTPVITLNVPTASAANRGALSSTDWSAFNSKQAALVSGTNIKTVNGTSLLGSGDVGTIDIAHGGTGQTTAATARVALLPSLATNAGKVLAVNTGATDVEWITAGGGSDPWTYLKLTSDFTTTSATAVNITGLEFTPAANQYYEFEVVLYLRTATTTVGPRPGLAWSTGLTDGVARIDTPSSGTASTIVNGNFNASLLAAVGGLPTNNMSYASQITGSLVVGASPSGTLRIQLASETAGTTVTAKAGSFIKYRTY